MADMDYHRNLTRREWQILRLMALGHDYPAIEKRLGIRSHITALNHAKNLYRKIGVWCRTDAARYAWENELVHRD